MAVNIYSVITLLLLCSLYFASAAAQLDPELTGTWTTKSQKVLTGPVGSFNTFVYLFLLVGQANPDAIPRTFMIPSKMSSRNLNFLESPTPLQVMGSTRRPIIAPRRTVSPQSVLLEKHELFLI